MTISYPLTLPSGGVAEQSFEIARVDYASPEVGGRIGSVQAGFPRWRMNLQLGAMSRDERDAWRAFLDLLDGSGRTFYATDYLRPFPAAYPDGFSGMTRATGGAAFPGDGACSSWGVNSDRDLLTLGGLPANFEFRRGDLVGFRWNTSKRTVVRIAAAATATANGIVDLPVRPAVPSLVPNGAVAYLASPQIVMRISTGETSLGGEDTVSGSGGVIVGSEDLRA